MNRKRKSRPGKDGSKQENNLSILSSNRAEGQEKKYRRRERLPAKASDFFHYIEDYKEDHPDAEAVLYVRVSGKEQVYKKNHLNHLKCLRIFCKEQNIPVIDVFSKNVSGKKVNSDRKEFIDAIQAASKYLRHGFDVFIFTTTADRYLRNENYNPKTNWKALPTRTEFKRLMKLAKGIPLVTHEPPDMPPRQVRGYQTKLGQQIKGNKGGRPKKMSRAERKDLLLPKVIQLKEDTGRGCCWIAKQVGVSSRTVWLWLKDVA